MRERIIQDAVAENDACTDVSVVVVFCCDVYETKKKSSKCNMLVAMRSLSLSLSLSLSRARLLRWAHQTHQI